MLVDHLIQHTLQPALREALSHVRRGSNSSVRVDVCFDPWVPLHNASKSRQLVGRFWGELNAGVLEHDQVGLKMNMSVSATRTVPALAAPT